MINEILMRRKNRIYLEGYQAPKKARAEERQRLRVLTIMRNMERLGERLHPGEYRAERYARVRDAFEKIRAGQPVGHFAGKVEAALLRRDAKEVLSLLKERSGELARRLDAKAKAVRGFVWWTNMENGSRVDLDLSAAIFDRKWNYLEHVSYTNLRSDRYQACHSGDIVNGGPADGAGVCEFLDVDLDSVL